MIIPEYKAHFNDCETVAFGRPIPPNTYFKINGKKHSPNRGWLIVVRCPYCGREHVHGWDKDNLPDDPNQTRKAHCPGDHYRIVVEGDK